jgi:hypothetical protein
MPVPEVYRFGGDIKVHFEAGAAFESGTHPIDTLVGAGYQ